MIKPFIIFNSNPERIFAGKFIKYGKGVNKATFNINGGNVDNGASRPDRNKYGTNNNLSNALAFSLQKHNEATKLCNKNAIVKAKIVDIHAKTN